MGSRKLLAVFDFDDTILSKNSDYYIMKLLPGGIDSLPLWVKELHNCKAWTDYMQGVFQVLHEAGIAEQDLRKCLEEITFVDGMEELLKTISSPEEHLNGECIIISDCNTMFIEHILESKGLTGKVSRIFSNPASFNMQGMLTIKAYQNQDWCNLSTNNLCKGYVLENYLSEARDAGKPYDLVAYIGDGLNDLCPSLKLGSQDLLFPRKKYNLFKALEKQQKIESDGHGINCKTELVKAKVVPWENGFEIAEELKVFCSVA